MVVPKNIGDTVNGRTSEKQPSISADGSTLYFSSNRPGGKGEMDIWVTQKDQQGKWGEPKNLGDSINTSGNEISPFIHPDNQTLYFSSDEHFGLGGFDIFLSRKNAAGQWQSPENIGFPINGMGDEISLFVNALGNKAFFATSPKHNENKDIYWFGLPKDKQPVPVSYMKGRVYNAETYEYLSAAFNLVNLHTNDTVNKSKSKLGSGEFLVCLPSNTEYALNVSKTGYLFYSQHFELIGEHGQLAPFLLDIPLSPIEEGARIVLNNIFFETDSFRLDHKSVVELSYIVNFLKSKQKHFNRDRGAYRQHRR
ncbi:MAG: hypothetical protein HC896_03990 [Bacteroidales bacterium]|nr:hypothetical protein [Bacteroidales bacterium]